MKILKKWTALLCSCAIIVSGTMPCSAAADEHEITVSLPKLQAAPGETVKVEMKLTENTCGILGFGMYLNYDAGLKIPTVTDNRTPDYTEGVFSGISCMLNTSALTIAVLYFDDVVSWEKGTIATFTMEVPVNAKEGTKYQLTPVIDECWNGNFLNVNCKAVSGYIEVKHPEQTTASKPASTTPTTVSVPQTTTSPTTTVTPKTDTTATTEVTTTTTEATTTTEITTTTTNTTTTVSAVPVRGDYNGDGEATVADAVLLVRYITEDDAFTDQQIDAMTGCELDFDSDGFVTLKDLRSFFRILNAG